MAATAVVLRRTLSIVILGSLFVTACQKSRHPITVAAAASVRVAMPELLSAFAAKSNFRPTVTYGSSGDLQRQVEAGAPIDGVVFASGKPVDALIAKGLVDGQTRRVLATNRLVLVGPPNRKPLSFGSLHSMSASARIAVGDPGSVPAGQYAKDYLDELGEWDPLRDRLVLCSDVAAALAYVQRGEVDAAIVYATDLTVAPDVMLFDEARGPAAPHPEVVGAATKSPGSARAREFLDFVASDEGQQILRAHGFHAP